MKRDDALLELIAAINAAHGPPTGETPLGDLADKIGVGAFAQLLGEVMQWLMAQLAQRSGEPITAVLDPLAQHTIEHPTPYRI